MINQIDSMEMIKFSSGFDVAVAVAVMVKMIWTNVLVNKKALREEDDNIPINNFWADCSAAFFAPLIQRWIQTPSYHTGFVTFLT